MPNAGCIFKNPEGDSAGRLIEAAGLKGAHIGDAQVSTKHANFIVNKGNPGRGMPSADTAVADTVAETFVTTLVWKFNRGSDFHEEV